MGFTSLAIFWMSFAAFIGPIFLIALVCSITKAIRTRKEIIKRIQHTDKSSGDPTDAEIITDNNVRRKPKIKLIEDEARKKQFRGNNGSLVVPASSAQTNVGKKPKFKDTDVDAQARMQTGNVNKSNIAGGRDVIDKDTPTASVGHTNVIGHPASSRNKSHNHHNHHNHHNRSSNNVPNGGSSYNISSSSSGHNFNQHNSKQHNVYYSSNNGHTHVVRDTDIIVHNHRDSSSSSSRTAHAQTHAHGIGHDKTRARSSYEGRRRKSLGDDGIYSSTSSSSYWNPSSPYESSFQNCNGHAFVSDGAHYRGANALYNHNKQDININHPGLKPETYTNRGRRHSVNSTSPTLERIPEVKAGVEVEMAMTSMMMTTTSTTATTKSKSEDNLIDAHASSYSSSPYLSNGGRGSDNRAFARSTETTIM